MLKNEYDKETKIERLGELYQKLKGTIFLRLASRNIVEYITKETKYIYPINVWGESEYDAYSGSIIVELKQDMTFREFIHKWL